MPLAVYSLFGEYHTVRGSDILRLAVYIIFSKLQCGVVHNVFTIYLAGVSCHVVGITCTIVERFV